MKSVCVEIVDSKWDSIDLEVISSNVLRLHEIASSTLACIKNMKFDFALGLHILKDFHNRIKYLDLQEQNKNDKNQRINRKFIVNDTPNKRRYAKLNVLLNALNFINGKSIIKKHWNSAEKFLNAM